MGSVNDDVITTIYYFRSDRINFIAVSVRQNVLV